MGSTAALAERREGSAPDRVTACAGIAFATLAVVAELVLEPTWPTTRSSTLSLARFAVDERDGLLVMGVLLVSAATAFLVFVTRLMHRLEPCGGALSSIVAGGATVNVVASLGVAAGALALAGDGYTPSAPALVRTIDAVTRLVVIPTLVTATAMAAALLRAPARPQWLDWALVLVVITQTFVGLPAIVASDRSLHTFPTLALEAWVVLASVVLWRGRLCVDGVTPPDGRAPS